MQNRPFSPTQRTGGVLPPLSKYYYGPAVSPERTPIQTDAGWNAQNDGQTPPALPPRTSSSATSGQTSHSPASDSTSAQTWRLPGPPPTAPPVHQVSQSSYNPNTYGPMPSTRYSPLNPTWNQSAHSITQPDSLSLGIRSNQDHSQRIDQAKKPPLPPRPVSGQSRRDSPSHEYGLRPSQDIDDFEYLQPIAYSPAPSPSMPHDFPSQFSEPPNHAVARLEPQLLPPPPPPKVPPVSETSSASGYESISHERQNSATNLWPDHTLSLKQDRRQKTGPADQSVLVPKSDESGDQPNAQPQSNSPSLGNHGSRNKHSDSAQPLEQTPNVATGLRFSERPILSGQWNRTSEAEPSRIQGLGSHASIPNREPTNMSGSQSPYGQGQETFVVDEGALSQCDVQPDRTKSDSYQANDSFYWHSPHSSAGASHEQEHEQEQNQDVAGTSTLLDATPEPQGRDFTTSPIDQDDSATSGQTTVLPHSILGPYSASALGFGGPSDWEHFGDYEGEEVDDTDLYIRAKPPIGRSPQSSELPADTAQANLRQKTQTAQPTNPETPQVVTQIASPVAPDSLQHNEDQTEPDRFKRSPKSEQSIIEPALAKRKSEKQAPGFAVDPRQNDGRALPIQNQAREEKGIHEPSLEAPKLSRVHPEATSLKKFDSHGENDDAQSGSQSSLDFVEDEPPGSATADSQDSRSICPAGALHGKVEVTVDKSIQGVASPLDANTAKNRQKTANIVADKEQAIEHTDHSEDTTKDIGGKGLPKDVSEKRLSLSSDRSVLSKEKEIHEPYSEFDPWARASLNRYIAMLREEARAPTDSQKLDIFKAFSRKEWKLRAVLYSADNELEKGIQVSRKNGLMEQSLPSAIRRPASKALPALPVDAEMSESELSQKPSTSLSLNQAPFTTRIRTSNLGSPAGSSGETANTNIDSVNHTDMKHQTEDDPESYSPGGRPIHLRKLSANINMHSNTPIKESTKLEQSIADISTLSSTDNKPAYRPFRYSQGYVDNHDQPMNRRASYRPYAALKLEPIESRADSAPEAIQGNVDEHPSPIPNHNKPMQDEQWSEQHSRLPNTSISVTSKKPLVTTEQQVELDLRRFERADFDPLIAVLPRIGSIPHAAMQLLDLQQRMDAIPDDFAFIHQSVVEWDVGAKKLREEHEKARHVRQVESEQRIDALFNDDEIGYGDIPELELEFKQSEAAQKADEDRAEYQTFVTAVFDLVWTRLHFEIDQLSPLYDDYTGLAHETLAGKEMFEAAAGHFALAPTMSALLTLHQKLEIRHQKAFEAVLERDRRLKKTELSPWYTLGNVTKAKQLEKSFDHAEKKAIVDYCRQRDARANRLMDVLDQNTLRGVGANQDYMEAVMKAVRRIASGRAFASAPANEPGIGMDEVLKAKAVTSVLTGSSEQIVQTFHVADMLLNAADYEVSVATAKLASADEATFGRLKDERAKEDTKLMRDLQHRLALIREDSRKTNDEIVKLLCFLGLQGGHGTKTQSIPTPIDTGHEERLQKALEEAKRRNALREPSGGLPS